MSVIAHSTRLHYGPVSLLCGVLLLWLTGCGRGPLLSDVQASSTILQPTTAEQTLDIRYHIGRNALVTIYLEDAEGQRYVLRRNEPRNAAPDPYTLRFDGTVPVDDPVVQRRLLPSGTYTLVVQAWPMSGSGNGVAQAQETDPTGNMSEARLALTISDSDVPMPDITNLVVSPTTISPNADAIDDIAELTYRLPVTATVDISITTPDEQTFAIVSRSEEEPIEQRHVWDGRRPDGAPLSSGVYTYTIQAEDQFGNIVQRQGQITLEDVGQPEATITEARIAPRHLMLGETLTVTLRVKNTGDVPIRTYGPPSGFTYTTDEVFSSVAEGRYTAQAGGFWRVGLDWDANSGGGPRRYPFRWALSDRPPAEWAVPGEEDWLLPGEEVEIIGNVVVLQRETRMSFYVGLIQDGVGFRQDRTARTIVEVGF